jgi:hypothetical protein
MQRVRRMSVEERVKAALSVRRMSVEERVKAALSMGHRFGWIGASTKTQGPAAHG